MSDIESYEIDSILSSGISLECLGIKNWALNRDDALHTLKKLEDIGVPVLGGDVYKIKNATLESTYDNWYCERRVEESDSGFLKRSLDKAREYISDYQPEGSFFALVPN